MHPLVTAVLKLKELQAISMRQWSPYYPMWVQMMDQQRLFICELIDG